MIISVTFKFNWRCSKKRKNIRIQWNFPQWEFLQFSVYIIFSEMPKWSQLQIFYWKSKTSGQIKIAPKWSSFFVNINKDEIHCLKFIFLLCSMDNGMNKNKNNCSSSYSLRIRSIEKFIFNKVQVITDKVNIFFQI